MNTCFSYLTNIFNGINQPLDLMWRIEAVGTHSHAEEVPLQIPGNIWVRDVHPCGHSLVNIYMRGPECPSNCRTVHLVNVFDQVV